jgi:hypothetical protein
MKSTVHTPSLAAPRAALSLRDEFTLLAALSLRDEFATSSGRAPVITAG